ncbi:hypothetical protein GYMLUDRAFT_37900 [Collybiopsis luxurians FD-317 M1]|nr:hypothetical protein GYMLUDRAFT_37900 [Collybiopsis luxurians FD-317 M1]
MATMLRLMSLKQRADRMLRFQMQNGCCLPTNQMLLRCSLKLQVQRRTNQRQKMTSRTRKKRKGRLTMMMKGEAMWMRMSRKHWV